MSIDEMARSYYKIRGVFPEAKVLFAYDEYGYLLQDGNPFRFNLHSIAMADTFPVGSNIIGDVIIWQDGAITFSGINNPKQIKDRYYCVLVGKGKRKEKL